MVHRECMTAKWKCITFTRGLKGNSISGRRWDTTDLKERLSKAKDGKETMKYQGEAER